MSEHTMIAHQVDDEAIPEITDWSPCRVRDGKFVEPCQSLRKACEGVSHGRMGLHFVQWSNFTTGKPTRSFVTLRSGSLNGKGGVVINNCPFCGVEICDPVRTNEERQARVSPTPSGITGNKTEVTK